MLYLTVLVMHIKVMFFNNKICGLILLIRPLKTDLLVSMYIYSVQQVDVCYYLYFFLRLSMTGSKIFSILVISISGGFLLWISYTETNIKTILPSFNSQKLKTRENKTIVLYVHHFLVNDLGYLYTSTKITQRHVDVISIRVV